MCGVSVYDTVHAKNLFGRPPHFGYDILYHIVLNFHGYMIAGFRHSICRVKPSCTRVQLYYGPSVLGSTSTRGKLS